MGRPREPIYAKGPRRRALSSSVASMISCRAASRDSSSCAVAGGTVKASEKSPPGWPFVPASRVCVLSWMSAASSEIDFWGAMVVYRV